MNPNAASTFELSVIPKGIADGKLALTIIVTPSAQLLNWRDQNLPSLLKKAGALRFTVDDAGSKTPQRLRPVAPPDHLQELLQPQLWDSLFEGVQAQASTRRNSGKRITTQGLFPQHVAALRALHHIARGGAEAATRAKVAFLRKGRAVRHRPSTVRLLFPESTKLLSAEASLSSSLRFVWELFLRGGPSLTQVAGELMAPSQRNFDGSRQLSDLLAGYLDNSISASGAVDRASALQRLGLHPMRGAQVLEYSLNALKNPAEATRRLVQSGSEFILAWAASTLTTAPYVPPHTVGMRAADVFAATVVDDKASLENRLAAIAQEFAIHPYLGLSIDMELDLLEDSTYPRVRQMLANGDAFVSVVWDGFPAKPARTAVGPDGQARSRGPLRDFMADGRLRLDEGFLSNLEVHGNLANTLSTMIQSIAMSDAAVRGPAANDAKAEYAALRSGPMTLYHPIYRKLFYVLSNTEPTGDDKFLEELVIGIRPDVQVGPPVDASISWRPLMDREISFNDISPALADLARTVSCQSRREGFIPLSRYAVVGSSNGGVQNLTVTESLFEWNGWNPAVPFPSRIAPAPPLLKKTIRPRARTNPKYRYGYSVNASVRIVLRDGSSSAGTSAPAPLLVASRGPGWATESSPYRLLRYEPLHAPGALLSEEAPQSDVAALQTATRVVLAAAQPGCSSGYTRSARYLVPGQIHDLIELDHHGAFDSGARPTDSALSSFERTAEGSFPLADWGDKKQPVLRRGNADVPSPVPYHPDPLVKRLRLMLVRQHETGELIRVEGSNYTTEYVHELYASDRHWPDAHPLRIDFRTATSDQTDCGIEPVRAKAGAIEIAVPQGENFDVVVFPEGDPAEMLSRHAAASLDLPADSPLLCEMLSFHVEHLVAMPPEPVINQIQYTQRQVGEHMAELTIHAMIDAGSTAVLELVASWTDPNDNPAGGALVHGSSPPVNRSGESVVADLSKLARRNLADAILDGQPLARGLVAITIPSIQHDLRDTHHRPVEYFLRAQVAATLGRRLRTPSISNRQEVDWLSTRSPAPIGFLNAAPSFRFLRDRELGQSISVREQAISLFFARDWGQSGPGELVGIVCGSSIGATAGPVSEWGTDPMRMTGVLPRKFMITDDFIPSSHSVPTDSIRVDATAAARHAGILLYRPTYDIDEDAWRVDLRLNMPLPPIKFRGEQFFLEEANGKSVSLDVSQPMLRLVALRFQPNAIDGQYASEPVLLDYLQMPSQRAATAVAVPGTEGAEVVVTVYGPLGSGSEEGGTPSIECSLVVADNAGLGALVWQDARVSVRLEPVSSSSEPINPRLAVRWSATILIPAHVRRRRAGLRLVERTRYLIGPAGKETGLGPPLYQDVMELRLFDTPDPEGRS